jgi:hypothetical protein
MVLLKTKLTCLKIKLNQFISNQEGTLKGQPNFDLVIGDSTVYFFFFW